MFDFIKDLFSKEDKKIDPYSNSVNHDVQIGDIWEYTNPNPFSRSKISHFEVIDIKDGFVLHENVTGDHMKGYRSSDPIRIFLTGSKLISRNKEKIK